MEITKIRLTSSRSVITLPFLDAVQTSPYVLKAATGLEPPEVDLNIAKTTNNYGVYQKTIPQYRELVFRIGLNPKFEDGQSHSDLRMDLYRQLVDHYNPVIQVELLNSSNWVELRTDAYFKNLEANIFSSNPEVQLTLGSNTPYFNKPWVTDLDTDMSRQFPSMTNYGTAPAGLYLEVTFVASTSQFRLVRQGDSSDALRLSFSFNSGDKLTYNAREQNRSIFVNRGGTYYNLLDNMLTASTWVMLYPGENKFNCFTSTNTDVFRWTRICYLENHWGI